MTGWTLAWLLWIAAFAVIEGAALCNRTEGDTLSEHVWRWLMPPRGEWAWRLRRFMLLAFLAWCVAHFISRGAF